MITLHGEEVKVGDKVWHWHRGWGEVACLDGGDTKYPIFVRWEEECGWFSKDGEFNTVYKTPVLFWQPIEFEIPKKPKQKEKAWQWIIKIGDRFWITYSHYASKTEAANAAATLRTAAEIIEPYLPSEIEREEQE